MSKKTVQNTFLDKFALSKEDVLYDLRSCLLSRHVSIIGRKEVYMGKAKFGIFGAGKELAQAVLARYFQKGDWRSGYYRDQTLMFALGELTPEQLFAQLYGHPDVSREPVSAGRLMNGHFGTKIIDSNGNWLDHTTRNNSSVDISPTAAQMPRLVGLAQASQLYRKNKDLHGNEQFSKKGNEVAWGTIGNASTAEGIFWEAINAAGVMQIPMVTSVWDDDYGISVHNDLQMIKGDISSILKGFERELGTNGIEIFKVRGWDYEALIAAYSEAGALAREKHIPSVIHVTEMTQPQGHSTSGSHERYKSDERLAWEKEYDCIDQMIKWVLEQGIATQEEIDEIDKTVLEEVKQAKNVSWKAYTGSLKEDLKELNEHVELINAAHPEHKEEVDTLVAEISKEPYLQRAYVMKACKKILRTLKKVDSPARQGLIEWNRNMRHLNHLRYSAHLYSSNPDSALYIKEIKPTYSENSPEMDGREVLNAFFDQALAKDPTIFAFGEDVGLIGDVNQGFAGLQEKHGEHRVMDTGIRECTIIGQAIGAAMRGLRPIAEIQYVDYILYAIQVMSDDLATLHYRSFGGQKSPVIIRTRGHRLEGVWHSGSPMGVILHSIRGVYIGVPRNMTQAAGMYNTLLQSGDPGIIIESLNGYRLKERLPDNLGEFTVPFGQVDILREGEDVTIVTYGSMCRIVLDAAEDLAEHGISCEVIDVQTLIPFDRDRQILESLKKTNKILFADEDVPGGTTAYMMQQVLERQEGYYHLDCKPKTLHSWAHRPAYATDGDYFSKANSEDVFDYIYEMMNEWDPRKFPSIYKEAVKPEWKSI